MPTESLGDLSFQLGIDGSSPCPTTSVLATTLPRDDIGAARGRLGEYLDVACIYPWTFDADDRRAQVALSSG